jgi:hypothetical protein
MICNACSSMCATCLSQTICLTCASGFVPQQAGSLLSQTSSVVSGAVQCVSCMFPCKTCVSAPTTCLSCSTGYYVKGNLCVTNFNFGFSMAVEATFP